MNDKIAKYSHGMRQRINLAQSLATDPDILFLDEPMAGLDPESREETFALIRKMGNEGKTVVVSSHILHEVERVTNNVVLLHNGSVLAHGQVREIRELIDEHPHTVTVECPRFRSLAENFVNDDSTLSIDFAVGTITIRTKDPNRFYQKLNDLVLAGDLEIAGISCPDDNLQSVFDYLVG
jgi:ABC-2 type transport system ATP-binding protein